MTSRSQVTLTFTGKDDQLRKTFGSVEKSATGLNNKFKTLGKAAAVGGAAIAAGVVTGGAALLKLGSSFDAASDTIIAGTGATGEALKGLETSFDNVLASGPHSMEETATAIADVNTALGLTGKPLESLTGQLLDLSRVTGDDVAGNIKSVTRLFGDWDVAVNDQALAMDKLFTISQATGIGVGQLSDQMVQFGAPLRQVGFSMEESAALMGKWNKEGVNTEIVMSGVRQAIGRMAKEGKDVPQAFAAAQKAIKEAGSASEATAIAIETFGQRAGPDMAAAIREGRFEIDDLIATMEDADGSIARTAEGTESFSEKWQQFKNQMAVALKPAAMAVFDALGKAMDKIGPVLTNTVIPAVREFFRAVQHEDGEETTITKIADAVRTAAKIIGEASRAIMKFIRGTLLPAIRLGADKIRELWGKIGPDVKRIFGQVVDVIKVAMALVKQLIATGTAVVKLIWDRWGNEITATLKVTWKMISGVISGALQVIKGIMMTATALLKGDWSAAWTGMRTVLGGVLNIMKALVNAAWSVIKGLTRAAFNGVRSSITTSLASARDFVRTAINAIISFFAGIPGRIARALSGLASRVAQPFKDAYYAAKRWLDKIPGAGAVRRIGGGIGSAVRGLLRHSGGMVPGPSSQQVPITAKGGEGVFTPGQMKALGLMANSGGGGGGPAMVEIHIDSGGSDMDRLLVEVLRKAIQNRGGGGAAGVARVLG